MGNTEGDAGVVDLEWTNARINQPVRRLWKLMRPSDNKKTARDWGIGLGAAGAAGIGVGAVLMLPGVNIFVGGILLADAIVAGGAYFTTAGLLSSTISTILEHHALYVETESIRVILNFTPSGLQVIRHIRDIQSRFNFYAARGAIIELEVPEGLTWQKVKRSVESTEGWQFGRNHKYSRDFVQHIEKYCKGKIDGTMFPDSVQNIQRRRVIKPSPEHLRTFGDQELKALLSQETASVFMDNLSMFLLAIIRNRRLAPVASWTFELVKVSKCSMSHLQGLLDPLVPSRFDKNVLRELLEYMSDYENRQNCNFERVAYKEYHYVEDPANEGQMMKVALKPHERAMKGLSVWLWKFLILADR